MSLLAVAGANSVSGGYNIDNSLKMESDNTEYLSRTNASAGNSKTFTFSGWYKFTEINTLDGNALFEVTGGGPLKHFSIYTYDYAIGFYDYLGGVDYGKRTTQLFRDTSAWYHIMVVIDTTDSTAADRSKMYVNGVRVTDWSTDHGDFPLNFDTQANKVNEINRIGRTEHMNNKYLNGYVAEVHLVDGTALAPTDFGEFDADTGIWKPIETSISSYGTNGFYLKFDNASDLGEDAGGGSSFTLTNVTSADQATDTPTNNFATWNVIADTRLNNDSDRLYFNEGGTQPIKSFGTGWNTVVSTQAFSSGKWYWEGEVERQDGTTMWGCFPTKTREANTYLNSYIGGAEPSGFDSGCAFYDNDDAYYHDNTSTACTISGGTVQTVAGDIIMIAIDMDNNKFYAGRNGQWFNSTDNTHANATGITLSDEEHFFAFAAYAPSRTYKTNLGGYTTISISSAASDANGYGNFEYAPPSGYYALCTKNLAEYGG